MITSVKTSRAALKLLLAIFITSTSLVAIQPGTVHAFVGAPVTIDNFAGSTFGTRTVTPLPLPHTSTTAQGSFTQNSGGTGTLNMGGCGNSQGGVQLDYASSSAVDLTSSGNNNQFFFDMESIQKGVESYQGENALSLSVLVTDSNGTTGTLNTGIANVFAFHPALPFTGPNSFSPQPDWTKVKHVEVMLLFPQSHDCNSSLSVLMGPLVATPEAGSPPSTPTPTVTATNTDVAGPNGTKLDFTVSFNADGKNAAVTNQPPSDTGLRAQDLTISGTAPGTLSAAVSGGPSVYDVKVSGMTDSGTVSINVPSGIVQDTWGQYNNASSSDPVITYTYATIPTITSATSKTFTMGEADSFVVTDTGSPTPTLSETGSLPAGLTFDTGTGTLSGTPSVGSGGSYPLTFKATNVAGTASQDFTLTADEPPAITSTWATTFTVGSVGTFTVTAFGYPKPDLSMAAGTLPTGVTFNSATGQLSGTPAAGTGGSYPLEFDAHNLLGTNTQNFTLIVNQAPAITSTSTTTFTTNSKGSFAVTATGYATPTLSVTGTLPSGVTFDPKTGLLAGTPQLDAGGLYPLTFTAANDAGTTSQNFSLTVDEGPTITSLSTSSFTAGTSGSFSVTTSGYPSPTLSDGASVLPLSLTFTDNGNGTATVTGTPQAGTGGTYSLGIAASNGVGSDAFQTLTLTVNEATAITSANSTTFSAASPGSFTVTTSGGYPGTPTLIESGALPSGVSFVDNGDGTATISGTPDAGSGNAYDIAISATEGTLVTNQSFTLVVDEAPTFSSAQMDTETVGNAASFEVTTNHAYPIPTVSETGSLPAGMTLTDNHDGTATLGGTPAVGSGGVYSLTLEANSDAGSVSQDFTLTVDETGAINSADNATFHVGAASSFTVTTAHQYPVPTISETGRLPDGVTLTDNSDGTAGLNGTPAFGSGGVYALTLTESNGVGSPSTQTFTLTVNEDPQITSAGSATFNYHVAGSFLVTTAHAYPVPKLTESGILPPSGSLSFVDNGDGTATIGGTPQFGDGGAYPLTITADNGGAVATQSFTLTVDEPPVLAFDQNMTAHVGDPSSFGVDAFGSYPEAVITESGALPAGMTFTDGADIVPGFHVATLEGTPEVGSGGEYHLTFIASNGVDPAVSSQPITVTLTVNEDPSFTSPPSATFDAGSDNSFTFTSNGFPAPTFTESGALPPGVTFDPSTGTLSGNPNPVDEGTYPITITAKTSEDDGTQEQELVNAFARSVKPALTTTHSATQSFVFIVRSPVTPALGASPTSPAAGSTVLITATFTAFGGPDKPVGTATIYEDGTPVGTAIVDPGTAILPVSGVTVGTHVFTVTYSGDKFHIPIVKPSAPITITVTAAGAVQGISSTQTNSTTTTGGVKAISVPDTGAELRTLPLGVLLLAGGIMAVARRRRSRRS